ncbi:MAG: hypothetical protein U0519_00415 [Candidatus Gracilibacteria bacterium]
MVAIDGIPFGIPHVEWNGKQKDTFPVYCQGLHKVHVQVWGVLSGSCFSSTEGFDRRTTRLGVGNWVAVLDTTIFGVSEMLYGAGLPADLPEEKANGES